ncbi:MAG: head GIN domain-containing protein [Chitinophagales bacterium]
MRTVLTIILVTTSIYFASAEKKTNQASFNSITSVMNNWGEKSIKGNGDVVKKERNISSFNAIDISGAFDVFLSQGKTEKLSIEADENLHQYITTKVSNGVLIIGMEKGYSIKKAAELNIFVMLDDLVRLEASGASDVSSKNAIQTGDLQLDLSGASDLDLELNAKKVQLDGSGAIDLSLSGDAEELMIDISGAAEIKAANFEVRQAEIESSGASSIRLHVKEALKIDASGASSVAYKGNPKVTKETSGACSIKKM